MLLTFQIHLKKISLDLTFTLACGYISLKEPGLGHI